MKITTFQTKELIQKGYLIIGDVELALFRDSRERAFLIEARINDLVHEVKTRSFRELIATDTE